MEANGVVLRALYRSAMRFPDSKLVARHRFQPQIPCLAKELEHVWPATTATVSLNRAELVLLHSHVLSLSLPLHPSVQPALIRAALRNAFRDPAATAGGLDRAFLLCRALAKYEDRLGRIAAVRPQCTRRVARCLHIHVLTYMLTRRAPAGDSRRAACADLRPDPASPDPCASVQARQLGRPVVLAGNRAGRQTCGCAAGLHLFKLRSKMTQV